MTKKDLHITFDPSNNEVIGVLKGKVAVIANSFKVISEEPFNSKDVPSILLMSKELYLKSVAGWIDAKEEICEVYGHYCGVMGYTHPTKYEILKEKMKLNDYSDYDEDTNPNPKVVSHLLIEVEEFDDYFDFEHG